MEFPGNCTFPKNRLLHSWSHNGFIYKCSDVFSAFPHFLFFGKMSDGLTKDWAVWYCFLIASLRKKKPFLNPVKNVFAHVSLLSFNESQNVIICSLWYFWIDSNACDVVPIWDKSTANPTMQLYCLQFAKEFKIYSRHCKRTLDLHFRSSFFKSDLFKESSLSENCQGIKQEPLRL